MIRLLVTLSQFLQKLVLWLTVNKKINQLHEDSLPGEPFPLFSKWINDAKKSGAYLYEAMALSTGKEKLSCRMVLLKEFSGKGFVFFTNYNSQKAKEIETNSHGALTFSWNMMGRQVRIEGTMEKITEKESDDYFTARPRGSQIGAWASDQSSVLPGREALEKKVKYYEEKFKNVQVPRPPHWGGYRMKPSAVEFWQARINRLHDRIRYTLMATGNWKKERLAP